MKRQREAAAGEPVRRAFGDGRSGQRPSNAAATAKPVSRALADGRSGQRPSNAAATAKPVSRALSDGASERRRTAAALGLVSQALAVSARPMSQVRSNDTNGGEWR